MRHLVVMVAGLGWQDVERRKCRRFCNLEFRPAHSAFPAVTCTAQASFRTATQPVAHGMVCNGIWDRRLRRPSFWEQSAALVSGSRIWENVRKRGERVGMLFWQQSLGEAVDVVLSPAPIHRHNGGMLMENYLHPAEIASSVRKQCGKFPLHRYWGPLASPCVGQNVLQTLFSVSQYAPMDLCFLYLPTLDYDFQRFGPEGPRANRSFELLLDQLLKLIVFAERQGAQVTIVGDYAIRPVTLPVAHPNRTLREAGLFQVRSVRGMAYPDFYLSRAFAMVDHEIAHVYVRDPEDVQKVADVLRASGAYSDVTIRDASCAWGHPSAGEILLTAKAGSWCSYTWWTDRREAPDYASHVDIHSKPGYDPCELFFARSLIPQVSQEESRIGGTHGRECEIAYASTAPHVGGDDFCSLARSLFDGKGA